MLTMPPALPLYRARVVTATYTITEAKGRYVVAIRGARSISASPALSLGQLRIYVRTLRRFNAARREI